MLSSPGQMRTDARRCQVSDMDGKAETMALEKGKPGSRGEQAG